MIQYTSHTELDFFTRGHINNVPCIVLLARLVREHVVGPPLPCQRLVHPRRPDTEAVLDVLGALRHTPVDRHLGLLHIVSVRHVQEQKDTPD